MFGFLSQYSQLAPEFLELSRGTTIAELVERLAKQMGPEFRTVVLDSHGKLQGGLEIVLDGEHIPARGISQIPLWKDCDVIFMPMISGG